MSSPTPAELAGLSGALSAQFEFEKWWIESCRQRDISYNQQLRATGRITTDKGVRSLLETVADSISAEIEHRAKVDSEARFRKSGRILRKVLESINSFELAYLVLTTATNVVVCNTVGPTPLTTLINQLAEALDFEFRYRAMIELEPQLPGMVKAITKDQRASLKHRQRIFINKFHKVSDKRVPSLFDSGTDRVDVGKALVELLFTGPGLKVFSIQKGYDPRLNNVRWTAEPSDYLWQIIRRDGSLEWLSRRTAPLGITLHQPGKRTLKSKEMLITRDAPLVKFNAIGGKNPQTIETLLENGHGVESLCTAITYLEQVPFRINKTMLKWVQENRRDLQRLGIWPEARLNIPECPVEGWGPGDEITSRQQEKLDEWKRLATAQHNAYWKDRLSVLQTERVVVFAKKLAQYPEFYYRWYADFRGRLYPLNSTLTMQGNGLAKCLLEFARPTEVHVGEMEQAGWYELLEYGFRMREMWSKAPAQAIEKLMTKVRLERYLSETLDEIYESVSTKDFLPYVAWLEHIRELMPQWGQVVFSGHPIRKDATCSSMQHMAALAGDTRVLDLTNCNSGLQTPRDLYSELVPNYKKLGLDRQQVKKHIMTYAYNSTDFTRKTELREHYELEHGVPMSWEEATTINDTLVRAVHEGLGRIVILQQWLLDVFTLQVSKRGISALSITPRRFVVDSTKYEWPSRKCTVHTLDATIRLKLKDTETGEGRVNKRRSRQAWVANIIHSLDAAQLQIALQAFASLKETRVDCATIHDCIACPPGVVYEAVLPTLSFAFQCLYEPDPKTGVTAALQQMMEFWQLTPELEKQGHNFQAVPAKTFRNMRYFWL